MNKVIQHVFDDEKLAKKLELDKDMPLERLKRERSKEKITWLGGGSIRILSAQTGNRNVIKEALIGEGGQNIIEEEAPHIPDDVQAMIMRMLMGHKDNYLLKIGNAFNRNHYFKSHNSDKYNKLTIDYHQGIEEGRITEEMIEEVKDLPFFKELYECIFPEQSDLAAGGYRKLISDELLNNAFITEEQFIRDYCTKQIFDNNSKINRMIPEGRAKLGSDFAGGGNDRSAYVIRWVDIKVMMLLSTNRIGDTMQQVPIIEHYMEDFEIDEEDVALDYGGLGQGVGDRLTEKENAVQLIMFGQSAPELEKDKYKNMRAYMYYQFFLYLKNGGKIVMNDAFYELLVVNYKEDSEKKFQIQPKEELKKLMKELSMSVTSPDVADAGALTFADSSHIIGEEDFAVI